ncbi:MAG TPA: type I restriction-modification enzyme R subunit C-terminal domain-containing protein [Armatimonadota bacterium]|nr:type I restriction-modification enzyme R subunit C-terminal domain-containing protein [Armatimonadota bacterium]
MPGTPEQQAREQIESQLFAAGWIIQDSTDINLTAGPGIAIREFQLGRGFGAADYLLYANRKAIGVVEAKKEGDTLTGVEVQTEKYSAGLPEKLPAWQRPLAFLYQSTGVETRFTNCLDPDPRSRPVFCFHQPQTLLAWAQGLSGVAKVSSGISDLHGAYGLPSTLLQRLRNMPPLVTDGMRPPQIDAILNLERSLVENRPRALVQMATGSGKTYTAVALIYRLIKYAGFRRILFLVDRGNLARQTMREFQQYSTPDDGRKFTEIYNVQHLQSNRIDPVSRVCITTIQRLYAMLSNRELDPDAEETSVADAAPSLKAPLPVSYNPDIPIETFDLVITDECHRSIYHLWRQVLEYFDSYLVGLTATPSKQTLGFFNKNLVMEYNHAAAVADGVNVDFDVYRIRTQITEEGSKVEAGLMVDRRNRRSRKVRWEELDEDLTYTSNELDRAVVAEDQIRTIIQTFRDRVFTEIFPGRTTVPKTLIFAKDDSHADDIVRIIREEFGKGNQFCEKITYRTSTARIVEMVTGPDGNETEQITYKSSGIKPEDLLSSFRNSPLPRIAVTVDMIATGTDVKPLEIVFFMRDVKSANYFEQMKGRGSRVILPDDFQIVTPDARTKNRFVIIDAVGVCEKEKVDNPSLDRQPSVSFNSVLDAVAKGSTDPDIISTLASRLARLNQSLSEAQRRSIEEAAGVPLPGLIGALVASVDPDRVEAHAKELFQVEDPGPDQLVQAGEELRMEAVTPFLSAALRGRIVDAKAENDQILDRVSADVLQHAGYTVSFAKEMTESFAAYIQEHRDEITALQLIYSRPYGKAPTLAQIRDLADALHAPPRRWTPDELWQAYKTLEQSRVKGSGHRMLTDLVSLVRFALEQDTILAPFADTVNNRFESWLGRQEAAGQTFTEEQRQWLEMIRDQVATSLTIEKDDFENNPFNQHGGLGKAYALFGERLYPLLEELNGVLAA